ncbi:unnamed protein product [Merluccius merluccius]
MERLPERDIPPTDTRGRTRYEWSFPPITWSGGAGGGSCVHAVRTPLLDGDERNGTMPSLPSALLNFSRPSPGHMDAGLGGVSSGGGGGGGGRVSVLPPCPHVPP